HDCFGNRRLRRAFSITEPKAPFYKWAPAGDPLIGPGENAGPSDARLKRSADLPGQDLALALPPLTVGVHAKFRQDQWLVDRDVVQPRNVAAEGGLVMQIDIEADEIREIDSQIFSRGIVGIANERIAVFRLDGRYEASQKAAHRLRAVPANNVRWDFVADEIGENTRVTIALAHPGNDHLLDLV